MSTVIWLVASYCPVGKHLRFREISLKSMTHDVTPQKIVKFQNKHANNNRQIFLDARGISSSSLLNQFSLGVWISHAQSIRHCTHKQYRTNLKLKGYSPRVTYSLVKKNGPCYFPRTQNTPHSKYKIKLKIFMNCKEIFDTMS